MTRWTPGRRIRYEGLKTVLSAVVIVTGLWVSGVVDQAELEGNVLEVTGELVGVWSWVAESPADEAWSGEPVASLFEFRQADAGLVARVLLRSDDSGTIEDVTRIHYEDGNLCLVTAGGTEFHGALRDDGSTIDGTIEIDGIRASARLERVVTRKRPQVMVPLRDA